MRGFKRILKELKVLRFMKSRKVTMFLVFFVLSLSLWFIQTLQGTYNTTVKIPVEIPSLGGDIAVSQEIPDHIAVEVRDKGFVLIDYFLSTSTYPIVLPFEPNDDHQGHMVYSYREIENEVLRRLSSGGRSTRIISISPQVIEFDYSPKSKEEIPVEISGKLTGAPGVIISNVTVSPEKVIVYGSKSMLRAITTIRTDSFDIEGITNDTQLRVALVEPEETVLTPNFVTLNISTEKLIQRTFTVPLTIEGLDEKYVLRTFPSTITVSCVVPQSKLSFLSPDNFLLTINTEEIYNNPRGTLEINVIRYPEFVQMVQLEPQRVEYILEER